MLKWRDTPDLRHLFRLPEGAKVNKKLAEAPYPGHPHLSVPGSSSPVFLQEELFWEDSNHQHLDTLTYIPSPVILPSPLASRAKIGLGNSICKLEPHPRGRGTRVLYYKHAIRDGEWNQLDPLALIRVYGLPLATFSRHQIPTNVQAVAPVLPTAKHETRRWKNTRAQDEHAPVLSHWSLSATFPPRVERDQFCWNFQAIVQRITRANPLIRALGVAVHPLDQRRAARAYGLLRPGLSSSSLYSPPTTVENASPTTPSTLPMPDRTDSVLLTDVWPRWTVWSRNRELRVLVHALRVSCLPNEGSPMSPLLKILRSGLWIEELAEVLHLLPTLKGSQVFDHLAARVELDFPVDESTTSVITDIQSAAEVLQGRTPQRRPLLAFFFRNSGQLPVELWTWVLPSSGGFSFHLKSIVEFTQTDFAVYRDPAGFVTGSAIGGPTRLSRTEYSSLAVRHWDRPVLLFEQHSPSPLAPEPPSRCHSSGAGVRVPTSPGSQPSRSWDCCGICATSNLCTSPHIGSFGPMAVCCFCHDRWTPASRRCGVCDQPCQAGPSISCKQCRRRCHPECATSRGWLTDLCTSPVCRLTNLPPRRTVHSDDVRTSSPWSCEACSRTTLSTTDTESTILQCTTCRRIWCSTCIPARAAPTFTCKKCKRDSTSTKHDAPWWARALPLNSGPNEKQHTGQMGPT